MGELELDDEFPEAAARGATEVVASALIDSPAQPRSAARQERAREIG